MVSDFESGDLGRDDSAKHNVQCTCNLEVKVECIHVLSSGVGCPKTDIQLFIYTLETFILQLKAYMYLSKCTLCQNYSEWVCLSESASPLPATLVMSAVLQLHVVINGLLMG